MRGRAFIAPGSASPGEALTLDGEESHYLVRVRRCTAGDAVQLLDGEAEAFAATVVQADPRACTVAVHSALPAAPPRAVELLVGIVDPKAMLEAMSAASEAGAARLVPVTCERAQPSLPSAARIARVLRAAARQCGRAVPLQLTAPRDLDAALAGTPDPAADATTASTTAALAVDWSAAEGYVAQPGAPASGLLPTPARVLIGPEGGLAPDEVERARARGFAPLGLSPFVLRTPTAVVASLARFA